MMRRKTFAILLALLLVLWTGLFINRIKKWNDGPVVKQEEHKPDPKKPARDLKKYLLAIKEAAGEQMKTKDKKESEVDEEVKTGKKTLSASEKIGDTKEEPLEWLKSRGVNMDLTPEQTVTRAEFMQIMYELWGSWLDTKQAKKLLEVSVNDTPKDDIPLVVDSFYQTFSGITVKPLSETEVELRSGELLEKWELGAEWMWFLDGWGYNIPCGRPDSPMSIALKEAETEKVLKAVCGDKIENLVAEIDLVDAQSAQRSVLIKMAREGAVLLERLDVGAEIALDQPITAGELGKAMLQLEKLAIGGKYPVGLKAYVDHVVSGP